MIKLIQPQEDCTELKDFYAMNRKYKQYGYILTDLKTNRIGDTLYPFTGKLYAIADEDSIAELQKLSLDLRIKGIDNLLDTRHLQHLRMWPLIWEDTEWDDIDKDSTT